MKTKALILVALCICAATSHAQFIVDDNGNSQFGSIQDYLFFPYRVQVEGCEGGIDVKRIGSTTHGVGIRIQSDNDSTSTNIGLLSVAKDKDGDDNYGVKAIGAKGVATNGTANFGVFGIIQGTRPGAGVYGTSNASDNYGVAFNDRYAGYFNGNTKIDGSLSVTGLIDGLFLTSIPSLAVVSETETSSVVNATDVASEIEGEAKKLSSLSLLSYYETTPQKARLSKNVSLDDTLNTPVHTSLLEQQKLAKKHYSLSPEDLEEVYPDLIYELEDGSKGINYVELIPILVQSINELNAKIEFLESANNMMSRGVSGISEGRAERESLSLAQNTPNPWTTSTSISVSVPKNTASASLNIYDMSGRQLREINISQRGNFSIELDSESLYSGIFIYALVADGHVVDSKRMIVSK